MNNIFRGSKGSLHFDDAADSTNVKHLAAKLVSEKRNRLEMFVLMAQGLGCSELAGVEIGGRVLERLLSLLFKRLVAGIKFGVASGNLSVVGEQLLKVLGAENVDLGQQQLALDEGGVAVVEDGPDRDEVLELPPSLLNDAFLARQHNGHAGQVLDLGVAHDERVNVEAASGQNTRQPRQHTGLVLDQAVEDVSLGRGHGGRRGLVEDVGNGGLRRPRGRRLGQRQGSRASSEGLVGNGGGRAAAGRVVSDGAQRRGRGAADSGGPAQGAKGGHCCGGGERRT